MIKQNLLVYLKNMDTLGIPAENWESYTVEDGALYISFKDNDDPEIYDTEAVFAKGEWRYVRVIREEVPDED